MLRKLNLFNKRYLRVCAKVSPANVNRKAVSIRPFLAHLRLLNNLCYYLR